MKPTALLFWSSGKDSAWALHVLRQRNEIEVAGLVTTFNQEANRVAMHGVRRELVDAQARAAGLPLWPVPLPSPCTNDDYEKAINQVIARPRAQGITHFAFGDLFLEDVRAYRHRQLSGTGIEPLFPLWLPAEQTAGLAREMLREGVRAILTCVDPKQLEARFAGREFDTALLDELPKTVDPCGERGEFHTFCHAGPMFERTVSVRVGEKVERQGFVFADLLLENG